MLNLKNFILITLLCRLSCSLCLGLAISCRHRYKAQHNCHAGKKVQPLTLTILTKCMLFWYLYWKKLPQLDPWNEFNEQYYIVVVTFSCLALLRCAWLRMNVNACNKLQDTEQYYFWKNAWKYIIIWIVFIQNSSWYFQRCLTFCTSQTKALQSIVTYKIYLQ